MSSFFEILAGVILLIAVVVMVFTLWRLVANEIAFRNGMELLCAIQRYQEANKADEEKLRAINKLDMMLISWHVPTMNPKTWTKKAMIDEKKYELLKPFMKGEA